MPAASSQTLGIPEDSRLMIMYRTLQSYLPDGKIDYKEYLPPDYATTPETLETAILQNPECLVGALYIAYIYGHVDKFREILHRSDARDIARLIPKTFGAVSLQLGGLLFTKDSADPLIRSSLKANVDMLRLILEEEHRNLIQQLGISTEGVIQFSLELHTIDVEPPIYETMRTLKRQVSDLCIGAASEELAIECRESYEKEPGRDQGQSPIVNK